VNIFGDLERLADDIYPYRWPLLLAGCLALSALMLFAVRRGLHRVLWRHKLLTCAVAVPMLLVTVPVGNYLLSPLWTRSTLVEASPLAPVAGALATQATTASPTSTPALVPPTTTARATPTSAQSPSSPAQPAATATSEPAPPSPTPTETPIPTAAPFVARVVRSGVLSGADDFHFAEGTALLIEVTPGSFVVRLENVSVRNGPDLFVYLSPAADALPDGALNLGGLKATDGSFNYDVPAGVDIAAFQGVVIWCRAFSVLFGTAPLS
jgi:Electron transfer DM13